ncbi:MAG TPA: WecB/TagA/CpsF family glycosyltransferase [Candidatus Limnocylindrales bacterium]|nr:WecB/TagA/CpsF family glycosyltransferase [Candidatus Limnocylindrales bacterium]
MGQERHGARADPSSESLFGVRFDLLTADELRGWVQGVLRGPSDNHHVAFSNAEFVLEARRNPRLRRYLNGCDLNLADGMGVVFAIRLLTRRRPERLSGTVFVATMCEEAAASGARVFLFGSRPGVAERAAEGLRRRAPGLLVCGTADGFEGAATIGEQVRATAPDVLVVCLGNPRQERWVEEHIAELSVKLVWGAGGALDFYSGDVPLAPDWVQQAGLEWLFRLVTNFSFARLRRQLRLVEFVRLVLRESGRRRRLRWRIR